MGCRCNDISPAGIDFILEHQSHGLPRSRYPREPASDDNFFDASCHPRGTDPYSVADFDRPTADTSGESSEIVVGSVDPLHRHGKGLSGLWRFGRNGLKPLQQSRSFVPRHRAGSGVHDIVTLECRQWNCRDRLEAEVLGEATISKLDFIEYQLRPAYKVHFIDCQRDVANAEHRDNAAVAFGLDE